MKKKKQPSQLKIFIKAHCLLLSALILLPFVGVGIFCIVFRNILFDAGAWGGIIAGIFTYYGPLMLGIFTFFHTWRQERIQAELQEVKISIDLHASVKDGFFVPYSMSELEHYAGLIHKTDRYEHSTDQGKDIQEWNFLGFTLKNINHLVSFKVKFVNIFYVNKEHKVQSIKNRLKIWESEDESPIDYKQTYSCFIGCDARILSREYMESQKFFNCFIVFSTTDDNNKVKYNICDYLLGETFGIEKTVISEEEYKKRIKTHGSPIILTSYNKQFFS